MKKGGDLVIVRLGYVAMSMKLENSSPSQTMTYKQFSSLKDRDAALRKLERIAASNLHNCLRLLRHNAANDIHFFRFSSKLIPLANHPELKDWDYFTGIEAPLKEIAQFLKDHPMRVDFHPEHFVVLTSSKADILKNTIKTLQLHYRLIRGMGVPPEHRCVIHVGGAYEDKEKAMEQFIHNFGFLAPHLQKMLLLENDDTVYTQHDALYLCEKLQIPLVFDLHHHLANHEYDWEQDWERTIATWSHSKLPMKFHISSPRSPSHYKAHADYVDPDMLYGFLQKINGTVTEIDCMIEAKRKDEALFQLHEDLSFRKNIEWLDASTFIVH
ncbi:UV DNA damage repair endonuclease UvsE [Falsibacillus albus]|uniref:UV DNA damage repair endonuclease UvsE n=1 Tax=Falsibacillus albus TaxID=2478915 RepID=A0A3L7JT10_9BACI|nr:UV DNA damage repair endonuclease UvsE [Falsibacillus albus]RLQ93179.1 UV DNA damage repair endonuclease UvsE [Falsibacillus albus]